MFDVFAVFKMTVRLRFLIVMLDDIVFGVLE